MNRLLLFGLLMISTTMTSPAALAGPSTSASAPDASSQAKSSESLGLSGILGIIGGVVGLLGVVVGVTSYLTKLQGDIAQSKLENELLRTKEQYSDLQDKYRAVMSGGSAAISMKNAMDLELSNIGAAVRARSTSILVPAPSRASSGAPTELVFLSMQGSGSQALKGMRVPMSSLAGAVYQQRRALITHNARKESNLADRAGQASKAQTSEMLAIPLNFGGRCHGVAEFLNKEGGHFDSNDQQLAEERCEALASKAAAFIADPENLRLAGITPRQDAQDATVLFCDLTASSALFKDVDAAKAIDMLNEYFEAVCDVALANGATIDKFIGDGVLMVFNALRPVPQHTTTAVNTALRIQQAFEQLKQKWTTFDLPVALLFTRIGIASGSVHRAEMGHPQFRQLTVMGDVVNHAAILCEGGSRHQNVVIVDETIKRALPAQLAATEVNLVPPVPGRQSYQLVATPA
jgi:class 3 adenylate cyclase